ncbi:MAG: lipopolysaccharide biosynthesis protein [Telluria sp.]
MATINQRVTTSIFWMVGAKLLDRSIGIVSTLVLARLLVPADFGLVAMATAICGILDLLGAFSFDIALIQNQNAERRHYDTVWTFNVITGVFCAFVLILLAVPASHFYNEARLPGVMYALSLTFFLNAFTNVGIVKFRKELQFRKEFTIMFARRLITFVVTLTAAWMLRSYWALLIGMTMGRVVWCGLSYVMSDYRPRFSLSAGKELFHFSKWMLFNNVLSFLRHDGCIFIIGRLFGANGLGIYSVSYEISNLPSTELVAPISRVMVPGFAKMSDVGLIAQSYIRLLGMITLLILPIGVGIAAVAEPMVLAALGDKWIAAAALIAILGLNGAIESTQSNNAAVCLALGQARKVTTVNAAFIAVFFPAMYFLLDAYGVIGVGYAYLVAQAVNVPLSMTVTQRLIKFRWRDAAAVVWRPILACVAMYVVVKTCDGYIEHYHPIPRLMFEVAVGMLAYAGTILALWAMSARPEGAETFCMKRAKLMPAG